MRATGDGRLFALCDLQLLELAPRKGGLAIQRVGFVYGNRKATTLQKNMQLTLGSTFDCLLLTLTSMLGA